MVARVVFCFSGFKSRLVGSIRRREMATVQFNQAMIDDCLKITINNLTCEITILSVPEIPIKPYTLVFIYNKTSTFISAL